MNTTAEMAAFGASDAACYKWPEDTAEAKACRAAYCDGAAWAADEIERLHAVIENEVIVSRDAMIENERLRAVLKAISSMRREDLYYADGYEHDNKAAAYAAEALNQQRTITEQK